MGTDLSTVGNLATAVSEASANRQYQLLGALLILIFVAALRKIATLTKSTGKIATFVNSDLGGIVLPIVTSAAGATYDALKHGTVLSVGLVLSTITNAALASGVFIYGKHGKRAVKALRKPKVPAAMILAFFMMGSLAGCGVFGKCMLDKLKGAAIPLVVDIAQALTGNNWESELGGIVKWAGEANVDCGVLAIQKHEEEKQDAIARAESSASPSLRARRLPPPTLEHARSWLAKHPANACRDLTKGEQLALVGRSAS